MKTWLLTASPGHSVTGGADTDSAACRLTVKARSPAACDEDVDASEDLPGIRLSSYAIEQPESPQPMSPWRQRFKWTVYALLFIDFILYLVQDVESAHYTLDEQSTCSNPRRLRHVDRPDRVVRADPALRARDLCAGRARLDGSDSKWVVQGVRLLCYVTILHTSFSYDIALREFQDPERLPAAADVCDYTDGWSFLRNRDYLEIDAGNCATIGDGPEFFAISDDAVVTDRAGLEEGLILAWTDLVESLSWLLIVFATEVVVRLKQRAFGNGAVPLALERIKVALYAVILAIALFWGSKGQILYLWDELVWVLGFRFIDWNIRDWRVWRQRISVSPSAACRLRPWPAGRLRAASSAIPSGLRRRSSRRRGRAPRRALRRDIGMAHVQSM